MHTLEKLSEVLEKRASDQLDKDLAALFRFVKDGPLDLNKMPQLSFQIGDHATDKYSQPVTLYFILKYEKPPGSDHYLRSTYMEHLRAELLPGYVARQISAFLEKVDSLGLQDAEEEQPGNVDT